MANEAGGQWWEGLEANWETLPSLFLYYILYVLFAIKDSVDDTGKGKKE